MNDFEYLKKWTITGLAIEAAALIKNYKRLSPAMTRETAIERLRSDRHGTEYSRAVFAALDAAKAKKRPEET